MCYKVMLLIKANNNNKVYEKMNCIIPSGNIRILNKALHTLARVGDELYIDAKQDYLQFATINQNKTSYVTLNFQPVFFSSYEISQDRSADAPDALTCKLHIKAMLNIFKLKGPKEKNIDWCKIELENDLTRILLKLKYKQDVVVIHSIRLIDMEYISVTYDKDKMPNKVNTAGSFYGQVLTNFQLSDEDMSLEIKKNKVTVRNYDVACNNVGNRIRSQVVLNYNEFTLYQINQECNITMCFKPFRAAVAFAETFTLPILMNLDSGGKPVIMTIKNSILEANFILSTISPDGSTQSCATPNIFSTADKSKNTELTKDDHTFIENINWDSDFEMDENDIMMKNLSEIRKTNKKTKRKNSVVESPLEDIIPESPESPRTKRLKIVFGRCYEPTFHESKLDYGAELAPNSDSE